MKTWPSVDSGPMSNDGRFVVLLTVVGDGSADRKVSGILASMDGRWKLDLPDSTDVGSVRYSSDNRRAVFMDGDRLGIAELGTSKVVYTEHVKSFQILESRSSNWLAYQLEGAERTLVLRDLASERKITVPAVVDFEFGDDERSLVLQAEPTGSDEASASLSWICLEDGTHTRIWQGDAERFVRLRNEGLPKIGHIDKDGWVMVEHTDGGATQSTLRWISLRDGRAQAIWAGGHASDFVLDRADTQVAFVGNAQGGEGAAPTLWYYQAGMGKARQLARDRLTGVEGTLKIAEIARFSRDGDRLFVTLEPGSASSVPQQEGATTEQLSADQVGVHVWSYRDIKLQTQQLAELKDPEVVRYKAVLNLSDARLIGLTLDNAENLNWPKLKTNEGVEVNGDEYALLTSYARVGMGEENWNPKFRRGTYLVSLRDGSRRPVEQTSMLSPNGRFVVYYDEKRKAYISFETSSKRTRNITGSVSALWNAYRYDDRKGSPRGVAGWLRGDSGVLIYDRNDLWQVDLAGVVPPRNLTNAFGSLHDIIFRLLDVEARSGDVGDDQIFDQHQQIILAALNRRTKDSGFYSTIVGEAGEVRQLSMGPYLYHWPRLNLPSQNSLPPTIKARDASVYLVRRMSATEATNVFSTSDFRTFTPLTDVHPERQYNWLTSELVEWQLPNGNANQGVLYEPENFDPTKKYPVIFQIYEDKSDGLHAFVLPGPLDGGCNINIASYVSHGYLVFSPDIFPRVGHPGQSALDSVESAVKYLSKKPWIDSKRMGIEGCSYGGFETNFVVTHSKAFAAAVTASGGTDFISYYGELGGGGASQQGQFEPGQYRIQASLWEHPELYFENSPVLRANEVVTPLLIMHTPADEGVPFAQAVELFTGLRRLRKRVWMLQYDIGNHGLFEKRPAEDFSLRMAQFFDHYLKGAAPPKWMTEGVPARLKGIETGLELNSSGREP